jgi:hypothetical protein
MGQKIMLEVTQPVVSGNKVVIHAGELFEPGARLPDGVTVRPVFVDASSPAPSDEGAKEEATPPKEPEPERPAKAAAKTPAK